MSFANRRPTIWSTASLRLAAIFSLLFGLGGAALIAGVDYGLLRFAEAEVRDGLSHQMAVMQADVRRDGGSALVRRLNAEARNRDARRYLLLVEAPDGSRFTNGLTRAAVNESGFRRNLPTKGRQARWPDQTPNMLVLSGRASDGTLLAVGRDTQHLDDLRGGIRAFAVWSGLALLALAVICGLLLGWLFLRRLESVNAAVGRIIRGSHGERLPAIGFGREFDDLAANLNQMLDRQEAALSALKSLSEGVAHELRAPLTRLRNRLEDAGDPAATETSREEALHLAVVEMDQMNALFESLLTLSRIESGAARLASARLDGAELIDAVGEIYRPLVEDAGGTLHIETASAGPPPFTGDGALVQQALANLIENAVRHADDAPVITLAAAIGGEGVVLSVSDRGPGIPPEDRDRMVTRFQRLERSKTRPGSGLGLTMAAAVARAHGGRLELTENSPGLRAAMIFPMPGQAGAC